MKLFKEHQYLLMRRESRIVIGKRAANLWLLVLVLLATFFAIAFSEGSMKYLKDKMNDPFTNWVNIDLSGADDEKIHKLRNILDNDSISNYYGFDGVQAEISSNLSLVSPDNQWRSLSTLFYEDLSSDLISAVISEENVIDTIHSIDPDSIQSNSIGVIITLEELQYLGYNRENLPMYVNYHARSEGAGSLGISMLSDSVYARAPLPLLAVVKRLPMNKAAVASKTLNYLRIKGKEEDSPIDLNHEKYANELFFFVPSEVNDFSKKAIQSVLCDTLRKHINEVLEQPQILGKLRPWKNGCLWRIYTKGGTPKPAIRDIEQQVLNQYAEKGVIRVYNYNEPIGAEANAPRDNVLSAHFLKLDSIGSFEKFVKRVSGLQIEMTQVNSKRNFWAVSSLASILSMAMIVFAIICIIIFITNMLQNHFQKVRRNLGTFKAFGISTKELSWVYIAILVGIVLTALVIALAATWLVELILPVKEQEYSYLILWNSKTLVAIIIILASTILTVLFVMRRLLRHTPGDLIYDR